jgi:outer membrane lipoprotein-sorting protein
MRLDLNRATMAMFLVILNFGIAVSSAEDSAAKPAKDDAAPAEILGRMAEVYKSCKSYSDSGVVKTIFFQQNGQHVVEKPFTTVFVRPDHFRFEYSSTFRVPGAKQMRHIVWAKGKDVRSWWDVQPGVKKGDSLDMALAGATGVSSGSAHTIPRLLMPKEVSGWSVTELRNTKRLSDAKVDNVACYRIEGSRKDGDGEPVTLWISKKTYLIHRIDKTNKFANFRTEGTTTYKPSAGIEIKESKLRFNPPEKGDH